MGLRFINGSAQVIQFGLLARWYRNILGFGWYTFAPSQWADIGDPRYLCDNHDFWIISSSGLITQPRTMRPNFRFRWEVVDRVPFRRDGFPVPPFRGDGLLATNAALVNQMVLSKDFNGVNGLWVGETMLYPALWLAVRSPYSYLTQFVFYNASGWDILEEMPSIGTLGMLEVGEESPAVACEPWENQDALA